MKCYDFWPSVLPINHETHHPLPYKIGRMKKIEGEGLKVEEGIVLWTCWFYWNGSRIFGEENCRLHNHLIINILGRNQSIPQSFCIEIVTKERKLLRGMSGMSSHVQTCQDLPKVPWGLYEAYSKCKSGQDENFFICLKRFSKFWTWLHWFKCSSRLLYDFIATGALGITHVQFMIHPLWPITPVAVKLLRGWPEEYVVLGQYMLILTVWIPPDLKTGDTPYRGYCLQNGGNVWIL